MFHWIATPLNYTHGKPIENRYQYGEWSIIGGFALDGQLILLQLEAVEVSDNACGQAIGLEEFAR
jgi:hypothetical protein